MIVFTRLIVILICTILLAGCENKPYVFDSLSIAFMTPEGNEIWGREVTFDNKWGVPIGSMSCCWDRAGAASSVFNKTIPRNVYIEWLDVSERLIYKTTIHLDEKMEKLAKNLPPYIVKSSGFKMEGRDIIIGFKENGKVFVWLSNATSDRNKTGRVKYLVGQAQATGEPWVKPK